MQETLILIFWFVVSFLVLSLTFQTVFAIQRARKKFNTRYVVLQLRVSRESEAGAIVAEQIYATLQGLQTKFSFFEKLRGVSSDHVSFEIASIGRVIKFYVSFPADLRNLVEGQIYAQYPDVEIDEVTDYSSPNAKLNHAVGVELDLAGTDIFPIKRYAQFEDKVNQTLIDPLSGLTSSLIKFQNPEDEAWIQFVVTPLNDKWRKVFLNCTKILSKGVFANIPTLTSWYARAYTTRKVWPKIVFFPVYFFFWIRGFMISSGGESEGIDVQESMSGNQHDRETAITAAVDKIFRPLFDVNIRIVYVPKIKNVKEAKNKLREIVGAFKQYNLPHSNGLIVKDYITGNKIVTSYHKRVINDGFVLSNEELATLYHLPNLTVKTPSIFWVESKKVSAPVNLPKPEEFEDVTILGRTNFRNSSEVFGIKPIDRRRHIYVIGKTGMGKSTLLENMIFSDIQSGKGVGVIDPHGDLAEAVLDFVPSHRTNDVILIDPSDRDYAVAFNMLENVNPALNSIVCSGLVGIFKKIYAHSWGPRLEHILRNTILTLLEYPGTTMLGIPRILQDPAYRRKITKKITDPVVKNFWEGEFNVMQERSRVEAVSPIQNKVGQFLSSPIIRNIVGQVKSSVDLRFCMDKGKIVIVNLSKGKIGEDNSSLLGAMFITKFQLDAMGRADMPQDKRRDFYLYVDEFQNFATDSFATILSEARKYRLNLTMANQYIAQMPDEVRDAVFGNVGSILSFQVGFDDADYLSQQFGEQVLPNDLVSLSKYTSYMKLLVDGMPTKTFSLATLPPPKFEVEEDRAEKVRKVSRERFSTSVDVIQDKIRRWSDLGDDDNKSKSNSDSKGGNNSKANDSGKNKSSKRNDQKNKSSTGSKNKKK